MPDRRVAQVMTRDLTALTKDTSLGQAARLFSMMRVTGLPVVNDEQRVIGFITEADLIDAIMPRSRDFSGLFMVDFVEIARKMGQVGESKVADFMTEHPITTTEDKDVLSVAETMLTEGIKIMPVVRDGVLIGTINRADICRVLMEDRKES